MPFTESNYENAVLQFFTTPAILTPTSQTFTGTIAYLRICLEC